jgi:hypothetical protein
MILFILNLCIPIILYFQLLAQNLYPIILVIAGIKRDIKTNVDFGEFSYSYTCIIVMFVLMGMTAIRQLGFFVKFNTFGVLFIFMIIAFIVGIGIYGFTNTNYVFSVPPPPFDPKKDKDPWVISLFKSNFPPLMGILGGGYYLHNITLPIVRNSANPKNNVRDVFIGYFLVFMSYTLCGVMGYFGFSGTYFTSDTNYEGIKSNCLFMFPPENIFATIIRFATFFQLLAAMCLMFACQRAQIYLLIYGDAERAEKQPLKVTIFTNFCILIAPFALSIFYPDVGKLAGYLGSMAGLGCIYVMPTITNLKSTYTQIKHPILAEAIRQNQYEYKVPEDPALSPKLQVRGRFVAQNIGKVKRESTEEQR